MKRFLSILFFIISINAIQAQSKLNFDSLVVTNQNYVKEDSIKLKMLLRLTVAYQQKNPSKGIETGSEAIVLAQKLDNQRLLADAYNQKGVNFLIKTERSEAIVCFEKALKINQKIGNKIGEAANFLNFGNIHYSLSNYPKALDFFQKALNINEKIGNKIGMAKNYGNIGNIYSTTNSYQKALEFHQKAYKINEELGNSSRAINLSNMGNVYSYLKDMPKALECYQKALVINERLGNKSSIEANLSNIGDFYMRSLDYSKALVLYQKALKMSEELGTKSAIMGIIASLAMLYRDAPDSVLAKVNIMPSERFLKVIEKQKEGLKIAEEIQDLEEIRKYWEQMSITYQKMGDFTNAYNTYQKFIVLRDSTQGEDMKKQILQKEMQYDFDKKETALNFEKQLTLEQLQRQTLLSTQQQQAITIINKEKDLQHLAFLKEKAEKQEKEQLLNLSEKEQELQTFQLTALTKEKALQDAELKASSLQTKFFIGAFAFLLLWASSVFIGLRRTNKEKEKSDALLLNILPANVAQELKNTGTSPAKQFNNVTVLFTDFENFTGISEQLSPTELVAEIHKNFTAFDAIIEKYGLEKIKTIGDAYLAVSGLPNETADHAQRAAKAAIEINDFVSKGRSKFQIRIGLSSGSVVAGIVGTKKYAYDIWGDTVNTAARMEQHSEVGKINISGSTYNLLENDYICTYRGKVEAKNKGEIDMYFL